MSTRHKISQWIRQQDYQDGGIERQGQGAPQNAGVQRIEAGCLPIGTIVGEADQANIVVQAEPVDDAAIRIARSKADHSRQNQRDDQQANHEDQRRRDQHRALHRFIFTQSF